MKVPRNVHGRDFANHLIRHWDFHELRQSGSHIILRTENPSGATVSVPAHKPIKVGTFKNILDYVSDLKGISILELLRGL